MIALPAGPINNSPSAIHQSPVSLPAPSPRPQPHAYPHPARPSHVATAAAFVPRRSMGLLRRQLLGHPWQRITWSAGVRCG